MTKKTSKNEKIMPTAIVVLSVVVLTLVALLIATLNAKQPETVGNSEIKVSDTLLLKEGWNYAHKNGIYVTGEVHNSGETVKANELELDFILRNSSGGDIGWCKVVNSQEITNSGNWVLDDEPSAKCTVLLAGYSASSTDSHIVQKETLEDDVVEIVFDKIVKNQ